MNNLVNIVVETRKAIRKQELFVVVVVHIYSPVIGERQKQTIGRSSHFSLK